MSRCGASTRTSLTNVWDSSWASTDDTRDTPWAVMSCIEASSEGKEDTPNGDDDDDDDDDEVVVVLLLWLL